MSLYVGNIPPYVRPEELLRVFRRFGCCNLQLKDGYGFIVYQVTADAEKALRALQRKDICGAPISLHWSNRQPKPFQRSARPTKPYEHYPRKNFREEDSRARARGFEDSRDFSARNSHDPAYNYRKHRDDVLDRGHDHGYEEDIDDFEGRRGTTMKQGNTTEPNSGGNDRWDEPISDVIADHDMRNSSEFDRYEPCQGYDREDEKETNHAGTYGSPYSGSPEGRRWRGHSIDEVDRNIDNSKPQPACYNCGLIGHIKRYCPDGDDRRERFSKMRHRRDEINLIDRRDGKLKMRRTSSWGRADGNRNPLISRSPERERKKSRIGKSKRSIRSDSISERKEKRKPKLRAESEAKKTGKQRLRTRKKVLEKKKQKSDASSLFSDSATSSSQSRSRSSKLKSKSKSRASSPSTSTSTSSRSRSASSSSKSASISSHFKSKSSRSKSSSRSSYRSLSLSVALDKKPSCSPMKASLNVSEGTSKKGDLEHSVTPSSKHNFNSNMENSKLKDGNGLVSRKIENEISREHSGENGDAVCYSSSTSGNKSNSSGKNLTHHDDPRPENHYRGKNIQNAAGSEGRKRTGITSEEMILALKHYRLPAPKEGESSTSVEEYFGAARLWPWEMIYYRRSKKGPITTENYARRLEQNKEFGIMDKYIRSSSGWGEHEQEDA